MSRTGVNPAVLSRERNQKRAPSMGHGSGRTMPQMAWMPEGVRGELMPGRWSGPGWMPSCAHRTSQQSWAWFAYTPSHETREKRVGGEGRSCTRITIRAVRTILSDKSCRSSSFRGKCRERNRDLAVLWGTCCGSGRVMGSCGPPTDPLSVTSRAALSPGAGTDTVTRGPGHAWAAWGRGWPSAHAWSPCPPGASAGASSRNPAARPEAAGPRPRTRSERFFCRVRSAHAVGVSSVCSSLPTSVWPRGTCTGPLSRRRARRAWWGTFRGADAWAPGKGKARRAQGAQRP